MEAVIPLTPSGWWAIAGLVLLALELVVPGVYLVWLGVAALAVAAVLQAVEMAFTWQLILFAGFSLVAIGAGWKWYRRTRTTPQGALRMPAGLMIGCEGIVEEAIRHGHGKVRIGDSLWLAQGPDLEPGTNVRVVAQEGTVVVIRPDGGAHTPAATMPMDRSRRSPG